MQPLTFLPVPTAHLQAKNNLAHAIYDAVELAVGDIVVISSKVTAVTEGVSIDLTKIATSKKSQELAKKCGRSPAFCTAVLQELARLHGRIAGCAPGALLTVLQPDGFDGEFLVANAGVDESNVPEGVAVGWPHDPVASAMRIRRELETMMMKRTKMTKRTEKNEKNSFTSFSYPASFSSSSSSSSSLSPFCLGVVISDSVCLPRRKGVLALALAVSGLDPIQSQVGKKDLYGKELRITHEAVADQLATAANMVMGNADQSIPAVIIRNHGFSLSNFAGWVPAMTRTDDLFRDVLRT